MLHAMNLCVFAVLLLASISSAVYMGSKQAKFVQKTIASNKVVIFSQSTCHFCRMVKEPFRKLNVKPTIIELVGNPDGREIMAVVGQITGGTSVPRVFIDGKFIGGFTRIQQMFETGALRKYFK